MWLTVAMNAEDTRNLLTGVTGDLIGSLTVKVARVSVRVGDSGFPISVSLSWGWFVLPRGSAR